MVVLPGMCDGQRQAEERLPSGFSVTLSDHPGGSTTCHIRFNSVEQGS